MTCVDPVTLSAAFDTDDVPTGANFDSLFTNFLSLPHRLDLQTADKDVVSTTTETSAWSALPGMLVPANALGDNGSIAVTLFGDLLYNNDVADTLAVRVRFGGSIVLTISSDLFGASGLQGATRSPWWWEFRLGNRGATNSQALGAKLHYNLSSGRVYVAAVGASAIDTTVDQTLDLTVQWSAASANDSFKRFWGQALLAQN